MAFVQCCRQWTIIFFTVYRGRDLKVRYFPVIHTFWYTDDLNFCSVQVISTSRKDNLLSYTFSILNCIDGWIEFTWSSSIWTSSWWGQRINVSYTYLSHSDGFSDLDSNAISLKYSICIFTNISDNSDPIASLFSVRLHHKVSHSLIYSQPLHQVIYWDTGMFFQ